MRIRLRVATHELGRQGGWGLFKKNVVQWLVTLEILIIQQNSAVLGTLCSVLIHFFMVPFDGPIYLAKL